MAMRPVSSRAATSSHDGPVDRVGGATAGPPLPFRALFIVAESAVALGALVGALQLMTGTLTPPVADLAPLGLSSWVLPGVWLFTMVAIPATVAAWLAHQRSPMTTTAVLWASALLSVELLVQIPFVGPSGLQAVLGLVAVGLAAAAVRSRQLARRPDARLSSSSRSARHG